MLRIYCAALVVCEIPTITRLLRGEPLSLVSAWFTPGVSDTPECAALYIAWLLILCASRTWVIGYPNNRGVHFAAAAMHAVEVPLYAYLMMHLERVSLLHYGLMAAIFLNPWCMLQGAWRAKEQRQDEGSSVHSSK